MRASFASIFFARRWPALLALTLVVFIGHGSEGTSQSPRISTAPRLEPVAETRLLMEGMSQPNYQALQKLLKQRPADADAWSFARGQALLLAETGNLLLIRPPRNQGQTVWLDLAADLRAAATRLARSCASQDYERSRVNLTAVAQACNRCHTTFRVSVRMNAGDQPLDKLPAAQPPPPSLVPRLADPYSERAPNR